MKMLKRILAAIAASAVSLCIFTACGSDPKYDTSVFIKTASAKTGYDLKESKSLDNALQAGMDALDPETNYVKYGALPVTNPPPTMPSRQSWGTRVRPSISTSTVSSLEAIFRPSRQPNLL